MKTYGVIMAGGGGTRFWPLSRQKTPKQLLNLSGKGLMVNEAIDRLSFVADKKDIFVVTNCTQVEAMLEATKEYLLADHILSEPAARNTAACIGYAAMEIIKKYGDGVMVITPSDHYIKDVPGFVRVLNKAIKTAEETDKLVTIGITPSFPSTGFGYIKYDKRSFGDGKRVLEFREKPDETTAKLYVESGVYAWNGGMFVWKASVILDKFKKYIPDIYENLETIGSAMNTLQETNVIEKIYPSIRKISVDYAIMEPCASAGEVMVVPGEFGWNDVGSWDMMDVLYDSNEDGNVLVGDTISIDVKNSVIYSTGKTIAAVDVDNLVIVETSDAIMVCPKDKAQDVKKIVDTLNDMGRTVLL